MIMAGYESDPRVEKGIQWLMSMRQNDGGWVIGSPGMVKRTWKEMTKLTSAWSNEPEKDFDWARPFSAAGTGMAIRALAVHPEYRKSEVAKRAAELLKSKFLKKDNWSWYEHPDNWIRFQYPYWWNHLISALDMLSLLGFSKEDADIRTALKWLMDHQESGGLWKVSYSSIHQLNETERSKETQLWITLIICRILKRFYD
jgi:squalene cyclase